jgi:hypothetical protein
MSVLFFNFDSQWYKHHLMISERIGTYKQHVIDNWEDTRANLVLLEQMMELVYWTQNICEPELRCRKVKGVWRGQGGEQDASCTIASPLSPYRGWLAGWLAGCVFVAVSEARRCLTSRKLRHVYSSFLWFWEEKKGKIKLMDSWVDRRRNWFFPYS